MKKTLVAGILFVAVGIGSVFAASPAQANTINDLEKKQTEVKNERAEVKKDLSKAEAEIADILLDLKELNEEIVEIEKALKHNEEMLEETEEEITKLEEEIVDLQEEINLLEENIEKRNDILKQRITSYQKSGGNIGFLQVLFGAKSFTEFISRVSAVNKITNSDLDLIKEQEEDKRQIEIVQIKVEEKLEEQNEQYIELKGIEEVILDQKKQTEKKQKQLKKKETELKKKKSELESKDSRLSSLEAQIRRDISAARNARIQTASVNTNTSNNDLMTLGSSAPATGGGGLSAVISAGRQYIGKTRYIWGSSSPANGGFDCSGFVSWAFGQAGYRLPPSTAGLSQIGQKVSPSEMQPGDLVFFNTYKTNGHVGIYLGNGQFLGSQSSNGVSVASMSNSYWKQRFTGHVRRIR